MIVFYSSRRMERERWKNWYLPQRLPVLGKVGSVIDAQNKSFANHCQGLGCPRVTDYVKNSSNGSITAVSLFWDLQQMPITMARFEGWGQLGPFYEFESFITRIRISNPMRGSNPYAQTFHL